MFGVAFDAECDLEAVGDIVAEVVAYDGRVELHL